VIPLRVAEIAGLVGGRLAGGADPEAMVDGEVVVDSRAAAPGGLFVALAGEHADGHDFTAAAVAAGAAAVLAGRDTGVPAVLVDDPQVALGRLARGLLDRLPEARVAGLTGSSG
jgi:UDP-N-acetylmuramoyl-tripeptide--D-alanyl-D-alanine ligase